MSAGPYPTKKMFEDALRRLAPLSRLEINGDYIPARQMSAGPQLYNVEVDQSSSSSLSTPIKTVEFSWQNVATSFDGILLGTLYEQPLTSDDIEQLEFLPLDSNHSLPFALTRWTPRDGSYLWVQEESGDNLPRWLYELNTVDPYPSGTLLAINEAFSSSIVPALRLRITFKGEGTLKLRTSAGTLRKSHSSVSCVAKDASGAVMADAHLSVSLPQRNRVVIPGLVPPEALPLVSSPTPITVTVDPIQGTEIVWPVDGIPYLHVFRQALGGAGEEFHLPLTSGLPQ